MDCQMRLSKHIPARTKTIRFRWCKRDFCTMSQRYRDVRAMMHASLTTCFWCNRDLEDGEMMALAAREKGGNVVLCQECAAELLETGNTDVVLDKKGEKDG